MGGRGGSSGMSGGNSENGKLLRTEKDGTKVYEKENVRMSRTEAMDYVKKHDSAVREEAAKQLGTSAKYLSVDTEAGIAEVVWWTASDPSASRRGTYKEYYAVDVYGTKRISENKKKKTKEEYFDPFATPKISIRFSAAKY